MGADPYKYFRVEAQELLEQLGQGVLDLEKSPQPPEVIGRLLRLAHTLKGAARVVRQREIADDAHALEDVFGTIRDAAREPDAKQVGDTLALLDRIGARLASLAPAPDAPPAGAGPTLQPVHAFRPDAADLEALVEGVAAARSHLSAVGPEVDRVDRIRYLIDLISGQLTRARGRDRRAPVDGRAVERVLAMVDELRDQVRTLAQAVSDGIDGTERELREVSDTAARLRLVPANAVFRFLERAARDVAQALGKPIVFEGRGDVRVDSDLLTTVQGALLQLVRNAAAHGIEPSVGARRAAGKPAEGRVIVDVSRRGATVSFTCSDDGRGIDFDAVRQILRQRGLTDPSPETLETGALLDLLFRGGISTSGTVTGVAGRGIGLDVVRAAAERLGGDLRVQSEPGRGTHVELVVPAAIASFDALLVTTANVAAAVPLQAVQRTFRVSAQEIVETPHGAAVIHDGASMPVWPLARLLHPADRAADAIRPVAFVIDVDDRRGAFAVDRISGTGTILMRPLPDLAPALPCVVGAAVDPGGALRLVLDPAGLIEAAQRLGGSTLDVPDTRRSILVVDDSLTSRMLEQSILEAAGYDVSVASSGEEALEKARARAYDLFLVDVEMPGIDGFTFIQQVHADPALRATPSILVTSRASAEDRQRGRDVGAKGYIVKSEFDQSALLDQIRTLVP